MKFDEIFTKQKNFFLVCFILFYCNSNQKKTEVLENPIEKIAISFSKKIDKENERLIVLNFTDSNGKSQDVGNIFSEKLTTELVKKGKFTILDRFTYQKKLKEIDLNLSPTSDLGELRKVSDVLNLKYVVTGILTRYQSGYGINARLIDPKTGLIISAEEAFYASE